MTITSRVCLVNHNILMVHFRNKLRLKKYKLSLRNKVECVSTMLSRNMGDQEKAILRLA